MKLIRNVITAAAIALVPMAANAASKDITREIPVTDDFVELDLDGFGYLMRISIIKGPEFYELCGAGVYYNSQFRSQARRFLSHSNLDDGQTRAVKGLSFFTRVKKKNQLMGASAKCRATNVPSSKRNPDWGIDWSGHTYYY